MSKTEEYLGFFPNYSVLGIHYCSKNLRCFEQFIWFLKKHSYPCNLWQAGFPICQKCLLNISASKVDLSNIVCLFLNSCEWEALWKYFTKMKKKKSLSKEDIPSVPARCTYLSCWAQRWVPRFVVAPAGQCFSAGNPRSPPQPPSFRNLPQQQGSSKQSFQLCNKKLHAGESS